MSEALQPVQDTPVAPVPATDHESTPATATAHESATDPIRSQGTSELAPESRPELNAIGLTDGTTAAAPTAPNVSNVPKEEKVGKGEVLVESHLINEGILNYKGPGLKGLIFSKKYFWLSDSPLEHKHLSAYLGNEKSKDIAHPNAAHAQQTGTGLLYFAKRAEDKGHPQGIFNLADVTDLVKGSFNDFGFSLHGHKHNFQAVTKAEKDAWIVTLETKAGDAKTSREGIVGSSGYKSALEKYSTPAAAGATGTSRSLSRPGKKASKSRERKIVENKTDTSAATATGTTAPASTGVAAETTPGTTSDHNTTGKSNGEKAAEAAATGTAVAAATRSGSTSEEDKKAKKSRSQSRNKRSSLFGSLLGKKEDHDVKKDIKKEEKEEKKEEKAEDKAAKKEIKKEEKAEKNEIKKEEKAEKKEEKAELKAEKKELKEEAKEEKKMMEKEGNPLSTGQTPGFNAHAIASRVIGEPVVPAEGSSTGIEEIAPVAGGGTAATEPVAAETTPTSNSRETAPKPNKRASLFGGLFAKKDTAALTTTDSAATETAPAVPAKDETSTVSTTAPQLENPVTEPKTEPTTQTAATGTPATTSEAMMPGTTTTPTEKRRSSFFGNLGTKKERKTGTTSGDEQTSGGFGGLLRKASRAQKGTPAAKDAADIPLPKDTPAAATTTDGAAEEKPALTDSQPEVNTHTTTETAGQTPVPAAA